MASEEEAVRAKRGLFYGGKWKAGTAGLTTFIALIFSKAIAVEGYEMTRTCIIKMIVLCRKDRYLLHQLGC